MRKKIVKATVTATMTLMMSITSFAAGWQQDSNGWWYGTNADNTAWYNNGWQWIDGNGDGAAECYYFDNNGYIVVNGTTPDGYQVDGNGAWIVNGAIQTQEQVLTEIESPSGLDKMLGTWNLSEVKSGFAEDPNKIYSLDGFDNIIYWSDWQISYESEETLTIEKRGNAYYVTNQYGVERLLTEIDDNTFSFLDNTYCFLDGNQLVVTGKDKYFIVNAGKLSGSYFLGYYTKAN